MNFLFRWFILTLPFIFLTSIWVAFDEKLQNVPGNQLMIIDILLGLILEVVLIKMGILK